MAGQGRKEFSDGEVLSAADVNGYLMDQSVQRFADAAARDAAIPSPSEGMVAYLDSTNDVLVYDGSQWVNFTGDITNVTAGTGLTGGGSEGSVTLDVDFTAVQENVITTQGDLVIGDASGDPVRLPVGSADQVLTSDGTTVSFQDAAGGGGGERTLLSTTDLSGRSINTVTITGISQDYTNLFIKISNMLQFTISTDLNFIMSDVTVVGNQGGNNTWIERPGGEILLTTSKVGSANGNDVEIYVQNYSKSEYLLGLINKAISPQSNETTYGFIYFDNKGPLTSVSFSLEGGEVFEQGTIEIFGES